VRLPSLMAAYRCERSMVCCHGPWAVYLDPHERDIIRGRLRGSGAPETARRFERAIESPGPGVQILSQLGRGQRCALLDVHEAAPPSCALQTAAGLSSLPNVCRNFPRSVVRTSDGVEVAFILQCPTAARLVVDRPVPFAWHEEPAAAWPYDPRRVVRPPIRWDATTLMSLADLGAVRTGWWDRLSFRPAERPDDAVERLLAMLSAPDRPDADATLGRDLLTTEPSWGDTLWDLLTRLPARLALYNAHASSIRRALTARPAPAALDALAASQGRAALAAAALAVQHAGVHSTQPARDTVRAAAWQTLLAIVFAAALREGAPVTAAEAFADALTLAAQVARLATFAVPRGP